MSIRSVATRLGSRYRSRLVAGILIVSVPITAVVAVLLTHKASSSLTSDASTGGTRLARSVALHVEDFLSERQENLTVIADDASAKLSDPAVALLAARLDKTYGDYQVIEVVDLAGHVAAASRPEGTFDPSGEEWFRTAASGQPVVTSPVESDGGVRWIVAAPVLDPGGRPAGVVIANLDPAVLPELLNPEIQGADVAAVDKSHHLVYDTSMGKVDAAALLTKGGLRDTVDNPAVSRGLAGDAGAARFRD